MGRPKLSFQGMLMPVLGPSARRRLALAAALAAAPAPSCAEFMSVGVEKAVVREGPGAQFPFLMDAWRRTPFKVLRWRGSWAEVRDFEGYQGWMHRSVLSDRPSVIVRARYANLREGPGREHRVLWKLYREYPLTVLDAQGGWLKVGDDEVEGWIWSALVWGRLDPGDYAEAGS